MILCFEVFVIGKDFFYKKEVSRNSIFDTEFLHQRFPILSVL